MNIMNMNITKSRIAVMLIWVNMLSSGSREASNVKLLPRY